MVNEDTQELLDYQRQLAAEAAAQLHFEYRATFRIVLSSDNQKPAAESSPE